MQFASLSFLFLFLPISLGVYYFSPRRWKREVMLGISIIFLLGGGIVAALIEVLLALGTFFVGLLLERLQNRRKLSGLVLFGTIAVYIAIVLMLRSDSMQLWETSLFRGKDFFPLGLSFFALQGIGYCIDVRRKKCMAETNWRNFFLYMLFFPRLIMGPVVSYSSAKKLKVETKFSMAQMGGGLSRFTIGLAKKMLLANWVGMFFRTASQTDSSNYSLLILWIGALAQLLSLYFELSGYADMAIGIALCFGVRLPESYGVALAVPTVAKFAEHWNRTVVQWFSHYIGTKFHSRVQLLRLIAIMITWGMIGLWYGFRLPTLLWGLGIGLCIGIEYLVGFGKRYYGIRYTLTALILTFGAVLLTLPDLSSVWAYVHGMVGLGHLAPSDADWHLIRSYGLALLIAGYLASGNWKTIFRLIQEKTWFRWARVPLAVAATLVLFCISIAVLLSCGGSAVMQLRL